MSGGRTPRHKNEGDAAESRSCQVKTGAEASSSVPRLRARLQLLVLLLVGSLAVGFTWSASQPERLAENAFAQALDRRLRPAGAAEIEPVGLAGVRERAADIALLAAARQGGSSAEVRENLHLLYVRGPSSPLGEAALTGLVALARERWPKGSRGDFLAAIAPAAVRSAQQFHIPPSVSLGQAALESAWGRSKLSREHNNLFGIKGGGAKNSVRYFPNNGNTRKRTSYRTYGSWEASVAHHAELLGTHRAYAKARPLWTEWEAYLAAVAPKYASNRRYANEVAWFIERYDLDQWDAMVVEASGADAVADAAMPSDE